MPTPILERAAAMGLEDYDPTLIIGAVNALWPMGKQGALAAIEEVLARLDLSTRAQGAFWVLRVLFDPPAGQRAPLPQLGTSDVSPPTDPTVLPRFPIVVACDVPLLVVGGYVLRGLAQTPEEHVALFRNQGTLRASPLAPPPSSDEVLREFRRVWAAAYGGMYEDRVLPRVMAQLARLRAS